ncbi:HyaD/HybD family hydrogenase maturation endopeptidase [Terasakiella sp. A23]|uniref:HyaD/HybD family hydrogenase maturation endopeptidase n=1 Tax=Terasakiella sp. FCG-A23 TaxID=3080561 RepID=UPI0029531EAC|nr:HyaD/HybD family hydrogenase maturation endopeptidase [Terasakiella sp. A23]MDV7340273.1 HyaD/HybD family hydrogenase maturation endopeptidase [Terasakiella sp. A23]
MTTEILVIGLGNVLMQDEGVGVRAVEALEGLYDVPENVVMMDGGTTGTELLEPMRDVKHLIVTDSVNTGDPEGTLVRLADEQVPAFFQTKISNHQLGLSDLLGILQLQGQSPETVTIIGMVPYKLEESLGLSPETEERVYKMLDMLVDEIEGRGVELTKRDVPVAGFWSQHAQNGCLPCA